MHVKCQVYSVLLSPIHRQLRYTLLFGRPWPGLFEVVVDLRTHIRDRLLWVFGSEHSCPSDEHVGACTISILLPSCSLRSMSVVTHDIPALAH